MNKIEFISAIAEKADISKKDAEKTLSAFTNVVTDALINGTEPLPAKAGRFGMLLKQPEVCALYVIVLPLLLPYLEVIRVAFFL